MSAAVNRRIGVILFSLITVGIGGYLLYVVKVAEDKTVLLPGVTTHGHYQIEMACSACHTNELGPNMFTSAGVTNKSCLACHGDELDKFSDSHPVRKFKNPENYIFLEHVNAMECVACHQEHNEKLTVEMGVTIPPDYCAHCHEVTLESLESHKDLAFNTCATAGCHNFHDNMALAPSFLLKHYGEENHLATAKVNSTNALERWHEEGNQARDPLTVQSLDAPKKHAKDKSIVKDWLESAHAGAGINCSDCHGVGESFVVSPGIESCRECHSAEHETFLKGKHGMRLAHASLGPMKPEMARAQMRPDAPHEGLSCNSCHTSHSYDREYASQQACLNCHNDEHSLNYQYSAHSRAWQDELGGTAEAGTGVSCATCHMPSVRHEGRYLISHDQTANLTPNEKMLRSVCMDCHGLQFAMDSLADPKLIAANFVGHPTVTHPGICWSVESAIARGDEDVIKLKKYLESISKQKASVNPADKTKPTKQN